MGDLDTGTSGMERGPRVSAETANIERLAAFLRRTERGTNDFYMMPPSTSDQYRDQARAMVRDFDELEDILAELLMKAGRF